MNRLDKTRRFYRRAFRRVRIYLPLVAVLFLALALFLPISGGWLRSIAVDEIASRTGLPVEMDRLEVTVAPALVEAFGLRLANSDFTIGRVELDGKLDGLLGGGEKWPDRILVDQLPTLRLLRDEKGLYRVEGPFRELTDAIASASPKTGKPDSTSSSNAKSGRIGRTPRVVISGLPVEIERLIPAFPKLQVTIDELAVEERTSSLSPYHIELRGQALAGTMEKFFLTADAMPNRRRIDVTGRLSGVALPFFVPGLGEFRLTARNLNVELDAGQNPDGVIEGSFSARTGSFSVERIRVGGERWKDDNLDIALRFRFDPATQKLEVRQFAATGDELDVSLSGTVRLQEDFPGDVNLQVRRLPPAALSLGRGELQDRFEVSVEETSSSPTLRVEAHTVGSFANLASLETEIAVRLADWSVSNPAFPAPVTIDSVNAVVNRHALELRRFQVDVGGLKIGLVGDLPIVASGEKAKPGHLQIMARGDAETAFGVLTRYGLVPPEFTYLRAPVSFDGSLDLSLEESASGGSPSLNVVPGSPRFSFGWRDGELGIRSLYEPVRLEAGAIKFEDNLLELHRFSVFVGGVQLSGTGDLSGDLMNGDPRSWSFRGDAVSSGAIEKLVFLVARYVNLPELPKDLGGHYQLELDARGAVDNPEDLDYRIQLLLDDASATVEGRPHLYLPVKVRGLALDATLDRESLQIRRASFRIPDEEHGESTVELSGAVTDESIRADATVRTHLEYMTALVAKELKDVYMVGVVPAAGYVTLTPTEPLPDGPDLVRRWISWIDNHQPLRVHIDPEKADLTIDYRAEYLPAGPVMVTPREFPVKMENIRGNGVITPEGLRLKDIVADVGSAKGLRGSALLKFGHPTIITFDVEADHLNVNEWMGDWDRMPWATRPVSTVPRWKTIDEPSHIVEIDGTIKTGGLDFLEFKGGPTTSDFHFEAWSRVPAELRLSNVKFETYEGNGTAQLDFEFPKGQRPWLRVASEFKDIDLDPFMDTLRKVDQKMDGKMTGKLEFQGQILNYPTYTGQGEFKIVNSSVLGSIIFEYAKEFIELASKSGGRDAEIVGAVNMANEEIHFSKLNITHPKLNIVALGYIDFRGRLFFDVWASVLSKQLKRIPLVGTFVIPLEKLGEQLLAYRVRGKLGVPEYYPIPGLLTKFQDLRSPAERESTTPTQEGQLP